MNKTYGRFESALVGYTVTELPSAGAYEYIYKNEELLVKLDQLGVSFVQITPPTGVALLKREKTRGGISRQSVFRFRRGSS